MPLPKRAIVPVNVSCVDVPKEIDNELEYVANATLSNLTRQLASLCIQASDIFSELTENLTEITNRSERLNNRIDTLKQTLSKTAIREEDLMMGLVALQGSPFRSRMEADQQVLNKNSMPHSIAEIYYQTEPPPALDQLDKYRHDNKSSMKFYTDPTFFFHLWCQEMLQENKPKKKKKRKKGKKLQNQQPIHKGDNQSLKSGADAVGKALQNKLSNGSSGPLNKSKISSPIIREKSNNNQSGDANLSDRINSNSFNGFELPPPLLPTMESHTINLPQPQFNYEDVAIYNTISPPQFDAPPPPLPMENNNAQYLQQKPPGVHSPGPPPPPPVSLSNIAPINHPSPPNPPPPPPPTSSNNNTNNNNTANNNPPPPPPPITGQNDDNTSTPLDLLTAIRNGIQLRKVEETETNRPVPISEAVSKAERKFDVQAIFEAVYKRRPFVENNSDSEDVSEDDEDSSLWSSDNENSHK